MIKLKNEGERARIRGIQPETVFAINVAYSVWHEELYRKENLLVPPDMVITSLGELGDFRKKGSRHLNGFAFDIRTRDLAPAQVLIIADKLRDALGSDFDVVVESNHIHVEFDPKP